MNLQYLVLFKQKIVLVWALVASSGAYASLFPGSVKLFKGGIQLVLRCNKVVVEVKIIKSTVLTRDVCLALCPSAVK